MLEIALNAQEQLSKKQLFFFAWSNNQGLARVFPSCSFLTIKMGISRTSILICGYLALLDENYEEIT